MIEIKDCVSSENVMSILHKRKSDEEPDTWHHFGFESVKELQDAVRLVACVLDVQLCDSDAALDLRKLVSFDTPSCIVEAISFPF